VILGDAESRLVDPADPSLELRGQANLTIPSLSEISTRCTNQRRRALLT
jgi:hypothetical protein